MRVGVAAETKPGERRVALTPSGVRALTALGAEVLVESHAGDGAGFDDADYADAGGSVIADVEEVWATSELLLKVKEPVPPEYGLLRDDLVLFTYLHLAADPALTRALMDAGTTAIAYETVTDGANRLPLLAPMSEIAGRLASQAAAQCLLTPNGGAGVLIGGAPGVAPARVVILGGGVVGMNAARVACGLGAEVTILERTPARLRELEQLFDGRVRVLMSDEEALREELAGADVVIGAVLVPGAAATTMITRQMLGLMQRGSVIVDVAIDQGGCVETSRPTTYDEPTFTVAGVVHYCVANMPGAVPVTSTRALTNATLPYVLALAGRGVDPAFDADAGLAAGLNVCAGRIVRAEVEAAFAATAPSVVGSLS